ncbi:hypothetical protein NDU88_011036 [Pleurodeles waltl]|uniref:Uncharacterized protein n=1 Tax=Pleurodeles waltl TaxID=8319 RepID=A0AAV7R0F4_PLEWA|nr:hypothetical protein NDU88_011036 [Pleurodeles waltl]
MKHGFPIIFPRFYSIHQFYRALVYLTLGFPSAIEIGWTMEEYLDCVGPLKVELIAKKKGQKRKSKVFGEGPSAKKGTPLRNKTEMAQENFEGDRRKRERTATQLKDITTSRHQLQLRTTQL